MKHLKTIISVLAILASVSCAKNQTSGNGQVVFMVSSDDAVADCTRSNISDYTALPATGDFVISIRDEESYIVFDGKLSEWDSTTQLTEGYYSVEACFGELETEGFDKPYFHGRHDFMVNGGKTEEVSIPVSLGNTIIKVECTENFRKYYNDYSFTLMRDGNPIAVIGKEETRAVFVDGYRFSINATISYESNSYEIIREYTDLDAATAYVIRFDVTNVGGGSITITFHDEVETVDLGDYELND